jgi:hypothetical protein
MNFAYAYRLAAQDQPPRPSLDVAFDFAALAFCQARFLLLLISDSLKK